MIRNDYSHCSLDLAWKYLLLSQFDCEIGVPEGVSGCSTVERVDSGLLAISLKASKTSECLQVPLRIALKSKSADQVPASLAAEFLS